MAHGHHKPKHPAPKPAPPNALDLHEHKLLHELLSGQKRITFLLEALIYALATSPCPCPTPPAPGRLNLTFGKGLPLMPQITNSPTASITAFINPLDVSGNPDTVESAVWSTDQPDVLTLTPSQDGLSCVITPTTPGVSIGSAQVTVNANDSQGRPYPADTATVEVVSAGTGTAEPGRLNLTFGDPTP